MSLDLGRVLLAMGAGAGKEYNARSAAKKKREHEIAEMQNNYTTKALIEQNLADVKERMDSIAEHDKNVEVANSIQDPAERQVFLMMKYRGLERDEAIDAVVNGDQMDIPSMQTYEELQEEMAQRLEGMPEKSREIMGNYFRTSAAISRRRASKTQTNYKPLTEEQRTRLRKAVPPKKLDSWKDANGQQNVLLDDGSLKTYGPESVTTTTLGNVMYERRGTGSLKPVAREETDADIQRQDLINHGKLTDEEADAFMQDVVLNKDTKIEFRPDNSIYRVVNGNAEKIKEGDNKWAQLKKDLKKFTYLDGTVVDKLISSALIREVTPDAEMPKGEAWELYNTYNKLKLEEPSAQRDAAMDMIEQELTKVKGYDTEEGKALAEIMRLEQEQFEDPTQDRANAIEAIRSRLNAEMYSDWHMPPKMQHLTTVQNGVETKMLQMVGSKDGRTPQPMGDPIVLSVENIKNKGDKAKATGDFKKVSKRAYYNAKVLSTIATLEANDDLTLNGIAGFFDKTVSGSVDFWQNLFGIPMNNDGVMDRTSMQSYINDMYKGDRDANEVNFKDIETLTEKAWQAGRVESIRLVLASQIARVLKPEGEMSVRLIEQVSDSLEKGLNAGRYNSGIIDGYRTTAIKDGMRDIQIIAESQYPEKFKNMIDVRFSPKDGWGLIYRDEKTNEDKLQLITVGE